MRPHLLVQGSQGALYGGDQLHPSDAGYQVMGY